jgi:hypothetical protein
MGYLISEAINFAMDQELLPTIAPAVKGRLGDADVAAGYGKAQARDKAKEKGQRDRRIIQGY